MAGIDSSATHGRLGFYQLVDRAEVKREMLKSVNLSNGFQIRRVQYENALPIRARDEEEMTAFAGSRFMKRRIYRYARGAVVWQWREENICIVDIVQALPT